jgi:hypothetical protein
MKQKVTIRVGHPAYPATSANRPAVVHSRTAAVEELRTRGFSRTKARLIVANVMSKDNGYSTNRVTETSDVVEVYNQTNEALM